MLSSPIQRLVLIALAVVPLVAVFGAGSAVRGGAPPGAIMDLAGCATNVLPPSDDGSSTQVALPFSPNFFGMAFNSLYVNNNGNVTIDNPMFESQATALGDLDRPVIAPFFADVDIDPMAPGAAVVSYGVTTVDAHDAFCVNWLNAGYYNNHTDKLNSFQLLLIDRSDLASGDFDIMFNYGSIQWESADSVPGSSSGLGGDPTARAGYSDGTGFYEIAGSAIAGCFLDSAASGLVHHSRDSVQAGRFVFAVRGGTPPTTATVPGSCLEDTGTATPTPTATPTRTPTPTATPGITPAIEAGDVDCSTTVTSLDALLILQLAAALIDSLDCDVGDVDGMGGTNAVDALLILQYVAGLIPGLPV
jgi:hypothetical protein